MGKSQRECVRVKREFGRLYQMFIELQRRVRAAPASRASAAAATTTAGGSASSSTGAIPGSTPSLNCSPQDQVKLSLILLRSAPEVILAAVVSQDEVTKKIEEICLGCIGYPKSVQDLTEFLRDNLVVHNVNTPVGGIPDTTAQGRLLSRTIIGVILECHSENKTWNGTFDSDHIRIIMPRESKEMFMMILKDQVEFEGEALLHAKVNDLRQVAKILRKLYGHGADFPVYVPELIQVLEGATTDSVVDPAFMEFLRYHPGTMASSGRANFVKDMNSSAPRDKSIIVAIVGLNQTAYPNGWKTVAESEGRTPITERLCYRPYGDTLDELISLMRNVLVHGNKYYYEHELEPYLGKTFSPLLPSMMLNLLTSGKMEELCGGTAWSSYKLYV